MNSQTCIDFESKENNFVKFLHVESRLVYGDLTAIPNPWITVVIPTFRRCDLLEQALDSVLNQWHTDFFLDIVVVDNEPDDYSVNETERLIQQYDSNRILYYRNSENIRPGDNFNRCFQLARGKWVMMLHDDDILSTNGLQIMGQLLRKYDYTCNSQSLGAIVVSYVQSEYDPVRKEMKTDVKGLNQYLIEHKPKTEILYRLTHNHVKVLGHIGGTVPSNGSTYRREAVLEMGGFNEDYGISGDLILLYNLENKYSVYQTTTPLGFYRWGNNSIMKKESLYRVVRDNFDFREYVYQKNWCNRIIGALFRNCHYRKFTTDAIEERKKMCNEQIALSDFDEIYDGRPNPIWYLFYKCVICKGYSFYKKCQGKMLARKAARREKQDG